MSFTQFRKIHNEISEYVPYPWNLYECYLATDYSGLITAIYYIDSEPLTFKEYNATKTWLPGYIETTWDLYDKEIEVNYINSTVKNKGIGTLLFCTAMQIAHQRGIQTIDLDDSSDRYRDHNNIYTKLGLFYVEEYGPEMSGYCSDVLQIWNSEIKPCMEKRTEPVKEQSVKEVEKEEVEKLAEIEQ